MKLFLLFVAFSVCLVVGLKTPFQPNQQFVADFDMWAQFNETFHTSSDSSPTYPAVWSPPISPLKGKLYFDWNQHGIRADIQQGDGAPWELKTTLLYHPNKVQQGANTFNITWGVYLFLSPGNCWYEEAVYTNLPNNIVNLFHNITFVSFEVIDGANCAVFKDSENRTYAVRLSDLALVQMTEPKFSNWIAPYIPVGSNGNGLTWFDFYNPVLGPVDSKYFTAPTGSCKKWPNMTADFEPFKVVKEIIDNMILPIKKNPIGDILEIFQYPSRKAQEPIAKRQNVPNLLQTFTADFSMLVSGAVRNGTAAFDFTNSGFYFMVTNTSGYPVDIKTGFIVSPQRAGAEFLFAGPKVNAWSFFSIPWLFMDLLSSYSLPPDVVYEGTTIINGDVCSKWRYYWSRSAIWYVRVSDGALVSTTVFNDPSWVNFAGSITFMNIKPTVDPNLYKRPTYTVELLEWSRDFRAHLPWYWCDPFC